MSIPHPQQGAIPLFRFRDIQVSLHWSWLLVAFYSIENRRDHYHFIGWAVAEYLALFLIVLLHEFGHAFATRSTGGTSSNILLWPFGGIAFVNAPHRPGAFLWSIAAGPLVNVALVPVLWLMNHYGLWEDASRDAYEFIRMLQAINLGMLIFNLLPIYPTDGGQILQALLWFKLGYPKALRFASGIGLAGGVALLGFLVYLMKDSGFDLLPLLVCGFLMMNCWKAFQRARLYLQQSRPPAPGFQD